MSQFINYNTCPTTELHLPGDISLPGTALSPLREDDEPITDEEGQSTNIKDSVLGAPGDLLPDDLRQSFLGLDLVLFRRPNSIQDIHQATQSQSFGDMLYGLIIIGINMASSVIFASFLCALLFVDWAIFARPELYACLASLFLIRISALAATLFILVHHQVYGARQCMRYNTVLSLSPVVYFILPRRYRKRIGDAILDGTFFTYHTFREALHSPISSASPLLRTPPRRRLAELNEQGFLQNGWIILQLASYPDLITSTWFPMRRYINFVYQKIQDWRRYRDSAKLYRTIDHTGAAESRVAILGYNIKGMDRILETAFFRDEGIHFIPKYVGRHLESETD